MMEIDMRARAGVFAENKDVARDMRLREILPALERNEEVVLDFSGVEGATQSFIHALISDLIRRRGVEVLDQVAFKGCNEMVRKIVTIVAEYIQEGMR